MTTQINFKIDAKLKEQALAKAKRTGISFSAYLRQASQEFVDRDISLAIVRGEMLNKQTRAEHEAISKDFSEKKNLSPVFSNAEEMDTYLDS